ncbi:alpha/beta hydrolase [Roseococcus sp. SDR]|uniref:alpha/beta hydrolase n=1 Tax=Roseococcus sp. SDR TaxID=2835532 RepID=UPI001BCC4692|nr:alpha/beta hydrolase [Roseococcus sp. SDR]MBS7788765.1 alpha/beta hydrolase [Roseococcus sp. SDR]MBV1844079.1 alpha/beta hydrolase [Roseococcus sp. SDR]
MLRFILPALLLAMPALAQITALPPETQAAIRAIGPTMGAEGVTRTAEALAALQPPPAVEPLRDQRYGPDPRHRLDVFSPGPGARPVLVFVHGGGFVGGDKTRPGAFYYDNIGQWAARSGLVGVNITYRLAPQHSYPAVVQDIAAAIAWVRANIAAHGGDPARIVLMGQSAGAAHVGDYLAAHAAAPGVASAVLVSGVHDVASYPASPTTRAYYGDDPIKLAQRSAIPGLTRLTIPLFLASADLEPRPFQDQVARLNAALCLAGRCPPYLHMAGHNHFSTVFAIGTADHELTIPILALANR